MAQTREETLDRIEQLKYSERAARKELEILDKQYTALLDNMKSCRSKIEAFEKERLSLEATLIPVKKCKPHEKATRKKQPTKVDVRQLVSLWSEEERQALIAALSAM